jgi:phosphoribosylaminoimidazolecarboxamide formyltransferase/IMP cyclohydrolase
MSQPIIRRALLSVSDKEGLIPFAKKLVNFGIELISTGGTYAVLKEHVPVIEVSELTNFPEMMEGRVKTLHPKIHGGLLAKRDQHLSEINEHNIPLIDLLVCNLYPFQATIEKENCSLEEAFSQIDIGGPSMLRSAAKNYFWVGVVSDKQDYDLVLTDLCNNNGALSQDTRFNLSLKAFEHTAYYDALIADYLRRQTKTKFPEQLCLALTRVDTLRYGENPHQEAAVYTSYPKTNNSVVWAEISQGKALSFNNLVDADTAWMCVRDFKQEACVIVKHANPCGVAIGESLLQAYDLAFASDPQSAFGGVIAFNGTVNTAVIATILERQFVEVIIATYFSAEALSFAQKKPNIRLLSVGEIAPLSPRMDFKRLYGGMLVQEADEASLELNFENMTTIKASPEQLHSLHFANQVCRSVKSNAIVLVKGMQTIGIGAGQTSRVFSLEIALERARMSGFNTQGAVLASDAFFPFADSIEIAHKAGISAIIQPGGSVKDPLVIAAANAAGIAMVFTGTRHFKH